MATSDTTNKITQKTIREYRGKVLEWYDRHGRDLPWRYKNGKTPNPYHVWLSEIMCQQTTVQAVKPYYTKFLSTWPTIENLASAKNEDVMAAWAGLGYYARARNLHKCAKHVTEQLDGKFPSTQEELKKLPGIGDYTSAAIATIAFNKPATVMDGNIERVMSRFFQIEAPLPKAKPVFKEHTARFFEGFEERPGDFAQSLMDIGAAICTPKNPKCMLCPLEQECRSKKHGIQEQLPKKVKAQNRPHKHGEVYWIQNHKGEVLFHKRPERGLLANMRGLPTSTWETNGAELEIPQCLRSLDLLPIKNNGAEIKHVFTHFDLTLIPKYHTAKNDINLDENFFWSHPEKERGALPNVFKKAEKLFSSL